MPAQHTDDTTVSLTGDSMVSHREVCGFDAAKAAAAQIRTGTLRRHTYDNLHASVVLK